MEVTLYNHAPAATGPKELIPNLIFKETLESLRRGEVDFYELVREEYSFESFQDRLAKWMYHELINNNRN